MNLGTVKDRIGSGHEYLIEWANQDNKQTCSIQHLVSLIRHRKFLSVVMLIRGKFYVDPENKRP